MSLWPRSLLSRLLMIVLLGLLLANALTLSLLMIERISTARSVMLGNLEYDVATSVAILDRVTAQERPAWLARVDRENYRYLLTAGTPGAYPTSRRSRETARSLEQALGKRYRLNINAVPGAQERVQAHLRLGDGQPLTIDIRPRLTPVARWLPAMLFIQLVLLILCAWLAVRQAVKPLTRFTRAVEQLAPGTLANSAMEERGPREVRQAARAFNAMQARLQHHLKERERILAAISHDLQTPITRMKLRVEMAGQPELRDKLLQDLSEMTHLVREGIAYARASEKLEEPLLLLNLNAFIDSLVCDYQDVGHAVAFTPAPGSTALSTRPSALRRILTNLIDNALKFAGSARLRLEMPHGGGVEIVVEDDGPGIAPQDLEAAMQPFWRGERSRNRDTGGTGLGLAIARQLALNLGGDLRLANRPQGGLQARLLLTQTP
ncbi:HAMP domain-containing protein [Enterobacteriaceae bacterium 4M9]|nr:HAMP domain-containing protein [Enterobacteriaceae bacterium 4M9]